MVCQRAPNTPEFAQPRLSRVQGRSSPQIWVNLFLYEDAWVMTSHKGTNAPKFVPPRWGRLPFDPTQTGLCKFGCVWSSLNFLNLANFKGKRPTPKNTHPNKNSLHKQFAQTLSACFLLILKGRRGQFVQTVPKLFAQTVFLFGCFFFFRVGLPFMKTRPLPPRSGPFRDHGLRPRSMVSVPLRELKRNLSMKDFFVLERLCF